MFTPLRRRAAGSRTLTTSLALAVAPVAAAQSTTEADGTIAVGSLGSTAGTPLPASGSLGSLAQPAYADYVALGDSYASLGDSRQPVDVATQCGRNLGNYPHRLDANPAVGALTDATCGAAQIPDLTAPQRTGVPPQVDALSTGTDLVTLSIGGNDVGFGTIVACITKQGPFATVPNCEAAIGTTIATEIAETFGEGGPLDSVYAEIADRSPGATVVATQYLPLMPAEGESCTFTNQLNPADVQWAREVAEVINDAVDDAAQRNGHTSVLPTDSVDRSACAPADQRWTDFQGTVPGSAPMHPTALGQQAMADAIAAVI
ncbi:MAG: SGNH/GDSL hydrolase family protein [Dietzia sp.]